MFKKTICITLCLLMLLAVASGCAPSTPSSTPASSGSTPTDEPTSESTATTAAFADTTTGGVMGYNENGINYFWGIPYAKAERFMAPEAYDAWEGYMPCWIIGEGAPQMDSVSPFDFMNNSLHMVEDEEKMFRMHIQSPDLEPETLKPVVFWIHGGGYSTGAGMEFDFYSGANLAEYGDVVFVSTNHRLNVLGYLDLSAYGDDYQYSGNVGILDLIFGLQWVQDNIEQFGGDPNNVTIVGQSGGGSKVTTLMSTPSAAGLFHKAAAFSGGSAQITRTTETAQAETEAVLEILGITADNIDDIKDIPYEELAAAATEAGVSYGPVVDGDLIPTGNYEISADIPFMAGSVLGEFSTNIGGMATHNQASPEAFDANSLDLPEEEVLARLQATYGDNAQAILNLFRETYPGHKDAGVLYMNDRFNGFMVPSRLLEAMNSYGGTGYQYVQAYVYPMFGGVVPIHTASCIPFWFRNTQMISSWIAGDEETANRVADQMAGALISFAHTGTPSQNGLEWEAWTADNGAVMVFDTESSVRYHHDDELFKLMAESKIEQ